MIFCLNIESHLTLNIQCVTTFSPSNFSFFFSPHNSSPVNAKKVNTAISSDSYIGLWRNYLILCCSATMSTPSSASTGSVRCSPPETLASTPDSGYGIDSKVCSPSALNNLYFCSSQAVWISFLLVEVL